MHVRVRLSFHPCVFIHEYSSLRTPRASRQFERMSTRTRQSLRRLPAWRRRARLVLGWGAAWEDVRVLSDLRLCSRASCLSLSTGFFLICNYSAALPAGVTRPWALRAHGAGPAGTLLLPRPDLHGGCTPTWCTLSRTCAAIWQRGFLALQAAMLAARPSPATFRCKREHAPTLAERCAVPAADVTLAGLGPAIFVSADQRLIH